MDPLLAVVIYLVCGVSVAVLVGRAFREAGEVDVTLDELVQAYDAELAHDYYAKREAAGPVIYGCEQHHSSVSAHRHRRERCGR